MARIFVYGTLKTGLPNNHFLLDEKLGQCDYIGIGTTLQKYPLVIDSPCYIPFMLNKANVGKNIKGEVYRVDEEMLKVLDDLENHPVLYKRIDLEVIMEKTDEQLNCQCYVLHDFKDSMLSLERLSCYEETHSIRYIPKAQRKTQIDLFRSVKKNFPN